MPSRARQSFLSSIAEVEILFHFHNVQSPGGFEQSQTEETCLKAAIACAIGAWEGFIEKVLIEYIENAKPEKKPWPLIQQFEYIVKKETTALNTPSWDKVWGLIYSIVGLDVNNAWWDRKFANHESAKQFFNDFLRIRHSFAHGFKVPADIAALSGGKINPTYTRDVIDYLKYMVEKTDELFEHDLIHRHGKINGWMP